MSDKKNSLFSRWLAALALIYATVLSFFKTTATTKAYAPLKSMSWQDYEQLVFEVFRQRGYSVTETRAEEEGTVDIVLTRNNETTYVHCKQWANIKIDVDVVRGLYTVMTSEGVRHGMVVTSGEFTQEAKDFSLGKSMLLFNGEELFQMFSTLKPTPPANQTRPLKTRTTPAEPLTAVQTVEAEPLCPVCNHAMIKRIARKGKNAGHTFWGCSQYPNCRGVLSG